MGEENIIENNTLEENTTENTTTEISSITLETIHNDIAYTNSLLFFSLSVTAVILFVLLINKIFSYFE